MKHYCLIQVIQYSCPPCYGGLNQTFNTININTSLKQLICYYKSNVWFQRNQFVSNNIKVAFEFS